MKLEKEKFELARKRDDEDTGECTTDGWMDGCHGITITATTIALLHNGLFTKVIEITGINFANNVPLGCGNQREGGVGWHVCSIVDICFFEQNAIFNFEIVVKIALVHLKVTNEWTDERSYSS